MNNYSKLTKEQMLDICNLISPDSKWELNQILDNDENGTDDIHEFVGNDESIMQFNIHRDSKDEIRCYLKGDIENDEVPIDKLELINDYLKGLSTNKETVTKNMEPIKNRYVLLKEVDKFTKIAEYEMPWPGLTLESELITEYIQSKDELAKSMAELTGVKRKGSGNSTLRMELIYRHKDDQDILILKLELNLYALHLEHNESIIKGAQIYLLLDENETLDCGKIINYEAGEGSYGFGLQEIALLETDFAFLAKLATANKIEYRVIGKRGKISEGEFNKSDVFRIKGFYNGLFDPEFMRDELLKQIEIDIAEEQKEEEERKRQAEKELKRKESEKQTSKPAAKKSASSCFVITATMGDPYHPIVDEFRAYRDRKLLTNKLGIAFVNFYYKFGPYVAYIISKNEFLRRLSFSYFVNPIYKRLKK